ncbi:hypothetical protein ACWCQQ_38135 [Streptomyces sp. NPDC002143]
MTVSIRRGDRPQPHLLLQPDLALCGADVGDEIDQSRKVDLAGALALLSSETSITMPEE